MPYRLRSGLFAVLLLAWNLAADAQSRRWYEPYSRGREALAAQQWDAAIVSLTDAAQVADKCESRKLLEGVHYEEYCPAYFLALAYAGAERFDDAERALERVSHQRVSTFGTRVERARADISLARERAAVRSTQTRALAVLGAGEFRQALAVLDAFAVNQPTRFEQSELAALRRRAAQELAQQLTAEGRALVARGHLRTATAKLGEALTFVPELADAASALADAEQRGRSYAASLETAIAEDQRGNAVAAKAALDRARGLDLEQYANDSRTGRLAGVISRVVRMARDAQVGSLGIVTVSCDAHCTILVDGVARASLSPGSGHPMALTAGSHEILGLGQDGVVSSRDSLTVRGGDDHTLLVAVADNVRARAQRAAERAQKERELAANLAKAADLDARIQTTRAETTRMRATARDTDTQSASLIDQIKLKEAAVTRELEAANRDDADARDAEAMARNSGSIGNMAGRLATLTGSVLSAAKKASADGHRRRAQQLTREIDDLSRQLYSITKD